jgi:hypothetical protein
LASVATSGAGPLTVGASWRRPALAVLLVLALLALVLALTGAGPLRPGPLAALLLMTGAPVLAAAVLAGAGALAGAVGGLLTGPRAVDALAARVVGLLEAGAAAGAGPPDGRGHRPSTSQRPARTPGSESCMAAGWLAAAQTRVRQAKA